MQLTPGQTIGTDVRLIRPLEEGGMGAVWVAEHIATGTEVAIKFVHRDLARRDPSILERFEREASVLGSLQSPHVVRIFAKGKLADETPWIVMELLKGESLVKRLESTGQWMSLDDVGTLIAQIAEAIGPVHAMGMVHRDLKGENVFLLDPPERLHVKVLDFGLVKAQTAPGKAKLTAMGTMLGSAEFMSPEQILSSGSVDHRADLWAVGVLAYMATTLSLPFSGEKLSQVLTAIRSGIFTPATSHRRDLPPAVEQWFRKAFHLDGRKRFESVIHMRDGWLVALGKGPPGSEALLDIQASGIFPPPAVAPGSRAPQPSTTGNSGVFPPPGLASQPGVMQAAQAASTSAVFPPPMAPQPLAGNSGVFAPPSGAGSSGVFAPPSVPGPGQAGTSAVFAPPALPGEAPNPFAPPAPVVAPPPGPLATGPLGDGLMMPKPNRTPIIIGVAVLVVVLIAVVVAAAG